jgi:DNA-binding NarL/FixJ family response regulator
MRMALRVLIADDHPLILSALRNALADVDDMTIVGEAASGTEVLAQIDRVRPDLILMDVRMPGMDGLTCLDALRRSFPEVKVVLTSGSSNPVDIQEALSRGASAYIVKTVNPEDLPTALRQVSSGTFFNAPALALGSGAEQSDLTEREIAILRAVASGLSNKAISRELWVTEQTVKFHLTNIYRKLGVANRTAAAQYAHQHGLAATSAEPQATF